MSSSYCSSCKIELQNDDSIREHYKSEIHRYNIKRKLVGLPPVTIDQFSKKKAQLVAESSQSERDQAIRCELCSKSFASKATYKQHLESKKHRENLKKFNRKGQAGDSEELKEEKSQFTTAEDQTVCLFCNKQNADMDENLLHMRLTHSFFVSEWKHLKDLQGLLRHLGEKVHKKGSCLTCDYVVVREGRIGESVQNHMLSKQHVFMNSEDFEEYERFYDFSRVIQDLRKNNLLVDGNDVVLEEDEYMDIDAPQAEEQREDDDWEVIQGEGDAEIRNNKENKTYRLRTAKLLDTGEIQLPNGTILGHRRFKNTYKQYYRESARQAQAENGALEFFDDKVLAARQEENRLAAVNDQIMRQERRKVEAQVHKVNVRKDREDLKLRMHNNKIQHYFREQLN